MFDRHIFEDKVFCIKSFFLVWVENNFRFVILMTIQIACQPICLQSQIKSFSKFSKNR